MANKNDGKTGGTSGSNQYQVRGRAVGKQLGVAMPVSGGASLLDQVDQVGAGAGAGAGAALDGMGYPRDGRSPGWNWDQDTDGGIHGRPGEHFERLNDDGDELHVERNPETGAWDWSHEYTPEDGDEDEDGGDPMLVAEGSCSSKDGALAEANLSEAHRLRYI